VPAREITLSRAQAHRLRLDLEAKLGSFEGMGLGHGILRAVQAVENQLTEKWVARLPGTGDMAL
jgi:hypothetical protein